MKSIDLNKKENIGKGKDMAVGFVAKGVISDLKRMDSVIKERTRSFQAGVYFFLVFTVNKIFDRSLLG